MQNRVKLTLAAVLFIVAILVTVFFPVGEWLLQVHEWKSQNVHVARVLLGLSFIVFALFMLPAIPVVMLSGFLFGTLEGLLLIWISGCIASAISFWIGRTLLNDWLNSKFRDNQRYAVIDRAVKRKGLWIALLSRMTMVLPYAPLNYFFSITNIGFRDYWLGTNMGIIPAYFVPIYLGTTLHSVSAVISGQAHLEPDKLLMLGGYLLGVLVLAVIIARSAFEKLEVNADSASPAEGR
jgi:uncharacterized membrane protein YdjX (TVP38/TMEM64 family)